MLYYEGLNCPVCNKSFVEDDDIVVCPQCGLPHHRICWAEIGKCYGNEQHGTAEQWNRKVMQNVTDDSQNDMKQICPRCKAENSDNADFCSACGYPLKTKERQNAPSGGAPNSSYMPTNAPMTESYSSAEQIGASNAADLAAVVGNNTIYYMDRFRRMGKGQNGGWNWAAFLLAPFWLFYRKQYLLGAVYLVMRLLSNISTIVVFAPFYTANTIEQQQTVLLDIYESPLFLLAAFLYFIFMTLKILLGLRANAFYFEYCEKKIQSARVKTPDLSSIELSSIGGVSLVMPLLCYFVTEIVLSIVNVLVGII